MVLLAACHKPGFDLPDRNDAAVAQEEARVAQVLEADTSIDLLNQPGRTDCAVRLLRKTGDTDWVYAQCTAQNGSGFSFPLRLKGRDVTAPRDGDEYAPSIREIFPADIARALIADEERYKP